MTAGLVLLLVISQVFQVNNNSFLQTQDLVKTIANDAADAGSLYYENEAFFDGEKVYNKEESNKCIKDIIFSGLDLDESGVVRNNTFLEDNQVHYTSYFMDETGDFSKYVDGNLSSTEKVTLPYTFTEALNGYTKQITEPMVIVTIDMGDYDYKMGFINDIRLVRTSGYEYQGRN